MSDNGNDIETETLPTLFEIASDELRALAKAIELYEEIETVLVGAGLRSMGGLAVGNMEWDELVLGRITYNDDGVLVFKPESPDEEKKP